LLFFYLKEDGFAKQKAIITSVRIINDHFTRLMKIIEAVRRYLLIGEREAKKWS